MGAGASKQLRSTNQGLSGRHTRAIHAASKSGDAQVLEQLLQPLVSAVRAEMSIPGVYPGPAAAALSQAVGYRNRKNRTPFLIACHHGSWECADLLLEAGSNILAVDSDGNGCLHLASINGHGHVVEQLLAKAEVQGIAGRLVQTLNRSGFSPLHYAAWGGHAHIVRQLLLATSVSDRLMLQICSDSYDRWLVVSAGSTALHVAAQQHHAAVVLAMMQHYALLLRDWVPVGGSSRRPADPRAWPDARGATPLHVALWKGLQPGSQLAVLLHHRTDVSTLFALEQLEALRKRGPPTLQVIASNALRSQLMGQLQHHQQELLQQQQLEAHHARVREQQRQQQLQQQQRQRQRDRQRHRERIWQQWWGREAAVDADGQPARAADKDQAESRSGGLHGQGGVKPMQLTDSSCGSSLDGVQPVGAESSPWHELQRTPSITLGAMQQYKTSLAQLDQQESNFQHDAARQDAALPGAVPGCFGAEIQPATAAAKANEAPAVFNAATAAAALLAPTSLTDLADTAAVQQSGQVTGVAPQAHQGLPGAQGGTTMDKRDPATATTAATATIDNKEPGTAAAPQDQAGRAPDTVAQPPQLMSASSITLGCLDRIWLATEEHHQHQEQHEQHSDVAAKVPAATVSAPATPELAAVRSSVVSELSDPATCCCSSNSSAASSTAEGSTNAVAAAPGAAAPQAAAGCTLALMQPLPQQQQEQQPWEQPDIPAVREASAGAAVDKHLYKGVGAVGSFQLSGLLPGHAAPQQSKPAAPAATETAASTAATAEQDLGVAAAAAAAGGTAPVHQTDAVLAGGVRCSSAEPTAPSSSHRGNANLASTSITIAALDASRQHQQHHQREHKQEQQHVAQPSMQEQQGPGGQSSGPNTSSGRLWRWNSKVHPMLATAGIKSTDWDNHLTPLAWKLLQQQHLSEQHSVQDTPPQKAQQQQQQQQKGSGAGSAVRQQAPGHLTPRQRAQLARSPHRRSFDLPGSSSGMSGALGARRTHMARMLSQVQGINKASLQGAAVAAVAAATAAGGSRRGSLDRASTMDVATSLAGALPGCVSEKLSQYLQVYGAGCNETAGAEGVGSGGCTSHTGTELSGGVGVGVSNARRSMSLFRYGSIGGGGGSSSNGGGKGAAGSAQASSAETCAVCMDQECAVLLAGCGHSLCFTCAGCIVGGGLGVRPPLCPFCRAPIRALQLAALHSV